MNAYNYKNILTLKKTLTWIHIYHIQLKKSPVYMKTHVYTHTSAGFFNNGINDSTSVCSSARETSLVCRETIPGCQFMITGRAMTCLFSWAPSKCVGCQHLSDHILTLRILWMRRMRLLECHLHSQCGDQGCSLLLLPRNLCQRWRQMHRAPIRHTGTQNGLQACHFPQSA